MHMVLDNPIMPYYAAPFLSLVQIGFAHDIAVLTARPMCLAAPPFPIQLGISIGL